MFRYMSKKNIKHENEKKLFAEVNHLYMTEESERDDVVYWYPLSVGTTTVNRENFVVN